MFNELIFQSEDFLIIGKLNLNERNEKWQLGKYALRKNSTRHLLFCFKRNILTKSNEDNHLSPNYPKLS